MRPRPRLSYANVVATLALVLAIGGGTVYAAVKLGKDDVKSRNIAKGAVKKGDLGKNAVSSPKIKNRGIKAEDIAAGVIPALDADVTGSATGGPLTGINANTDTPLPLTGTTTFTSQEGEVAAIAAEGRFTLALATAGQFCSPAARILVDGDPTRIFVNPEEGEDSPTPVQAIGRDADGPFGLLTPGTHTISAVVQGDEHCTPGTRLDNFKVSIVEIK
jgi:hypothetical protein